MKNKLFPKLNKLGNIDNQRNFKILSSIILKNSVFNMSFNLSVKYFFSRCMYNSTRRVIKIHKKKRDKMMPSLVLCSLLGRYTLIKLLLFTET